jgi:hypothetical protein
MFMGRGHGVRAEHWPGLSVQPNVPVTLQALDKTRNRGHADRIRRASTPLATEANASVSLRCARCSPGTSA